MKTILLLFIISAFPLSSYAAAYKKATEGKEVVLDKLYPRKGTIEINPSFGAILNQSYISSFLAGGGVTYFWKETSGISVDVQMSINSDKAERTCIESFFLDPLNAVSDVCGPADILDETPKDSAEGLFPRYGPAYVPIREMNYIVTGNYVWSPIYGKQLLFLAQQVTSIYSLSLVVGLLCQPSIQNKMS